MGSLPKLLGLLFILQFYKIQGGNSKCFINGVDYQCGEGVAYQTCVQSCQKFECRCDGTWWTYYDKNKSRPSPCNPPFEMVDDQCLMFVTDTATWDMSRSKCNSWPNTDIAIINNVKEVAKYMRANNKVYGLWHHVGATNRNDPTKHTWVNGNDVTSQEAYWFAPGLEPNLSDGNQCVHISPTEGGGSLADNTCNRNYPSICERK